MWPVPNVPARATGRSRPGQAGTTSALAPEHQAPETGPGALGPGLFVEILRADPLDELVELSHELLALARFVEVLALGDDDPLGV